MPFNELKEHAHWTLLSPERMAVVAAAADGSSSKVALVAVIGIIGPDDAARRDAHRSWATEAARRGLLMRFAVSARDRVQTPWWQSAERVESDVDLIDCLGQSSGGGVIQLSLFDGWLRFAVARFPDAPLIGRADDDSVINPSWLHAVLIAEAARVPRMPLARRFVYAGSFQWFHWDEEAFVPRGWGHGPWNARRRAAREDPDFCPRNANNVTHAPRCAGPFPFATGPLLLLSSALARWYTCSNAVRRAVQRALDSRLNRSRADGRRLPLPQARARGAFLQPRDAGDLQLRVFDDVFLGHALCMGGVRHVTLLAFPAGTRADVPCNGRGTQAAAGCRNGLNQRFNGSAASGDASGLPYVLHNVKMSSALTHAAALVSRVRFGTQVASCATLSVPHAQLACGRDWTWCSTPWPHEARALRRRRGSKGAGANRTLRYSVKRHDGANLSG